MFRLALICTFAIALSAGAQPVVDDPAIVQSFDASQHFVGNAYADAAANNVNALRKSLSHAIEAWDRTSKRYRDMTTNDEAWKPDFDKVTDSLLLASAQLSRNESMDSITAQLKTALDTIQGIRTRHSIPVYRSELTDVIERLETLQASLEDPGSLRKRAEDAAERLKEVLEAWQAAKATFMENNTADLPPGQLIQVRALAAEQDETFEELKELVEARRPLLAIIAARRSEERLEEIGRLATPPTKTAP